MSTTTTPEAARAPQPQRLLTIGAVCRRLQPEFPDISISKIRYLEDQGLLNPKRTQGGYRLFAEDDVERLETILRLQRDEFLPLRVIRDELASPASKAPRKKRPVGLVGDEEEISIDELCERSGITPTQAKELADFGLLESRTVGGERRYPESEADIAAACARLVRFGVGARHLRAFKTAADRETGLLEQVLAPSLRARSPERRAAAVDDLQTLAEAAQELAQLLFWRGLRGMVSR
jgi:DNA-binding transcriptional MerR regulator